jgi:predicted transcriptional regulator
LDVITRYACEIEHLSLQLNIKEKKERIIEWRRSKVQELSSQGQNQREIAQILQVSNGTVNGDLAYLRLQAKTNIRKYIDERLPEEYEKCMVGLTSILKEAWTTAQEAVDSREKIQALSLAKECYSMKLDLLTNATVVDDAVRFVLEKAKANSVAIENKEKQEEEKEGIDIQRSEEESKQSNDSTTKTTNQLF